MKIAGSVCFQDASGQFNSAYCPNTAQCVTAGVAGRIGQRAQFTFNGSQYVRVKYTAPSLNFDGKRQLYVHGVGEVRNTGRIGSTSCARADAAPKLTMMLQVASDTGQLRMAFGDPNGTNHD